MDITSWNKFKKDISILNFYIQANDPSEMYVESNNNFERLATKFNNLFNFITENDKFFTDCINKVHK